MRPLAKLRALAVAVLTVSSLCPPSALAQGSSGMIDAQKEALKVLSALDGTWRGPAWTKTPTGETLNLTQTERVGPFLGGAVKVVEGRGYDAEGNVAFNALGIISFDPAKKTYNFRTYAMGREGDYTLAVTGDGFVWEIPAGKMTIRYTAVIRNNEWHEFGERIVEGQPAVRFMEMTLRRLGDSSWPAADAVSPE